MGQCYAKLDDGWAVGVPWLKTTAGGWSRVRTAYRKTTSTVWTSFYVADLTAPAVPTLTTSISGTRIKIDVKAPTTADVFRCRVKVGRGTTAWANNNTDVNYISSPDGADDNWSDWLISPGQTRTKYYPLSGSLVAGTTYAVTTWAEDKSHNYSSPVSDTIKYQSPGVAAPEAHSAVIDPVDSKSWYIAANNWDTHTDKYLRTGASNNRTGFLFYSTRLSALLKGAASITSMKVQIQRYPQYDYSGATSFHVFSHSLVSRPSGTPMNNIKKTDTVWTTINKGQTLQVTVPSSFYADFLSGAASGLGIRSQQGDGSTSDKYAGTFYGAGTGSGRVTVTYTR